MEKKLTKKQIEISILKDKLLKYTNATSIDRKWFYKKLKIKEMEELRILIEIHSQIKKFKYINIYKNRSGLLDRIEISNIKNERLSIVLTLKD